MPTGIGWGEILALALMWLVGAYILYQTFRRN